MRRKKRTLFFYKDGVIQELFVRSGFSSTDGYPYLYIVDGQGKVLEWTVNYPCGSTFEEVYKLVSDKIKADIVAHKAYIKEQKKKLKILEQDCNEYKRRESQT